MEYLSLPLALRDGFLPRTSLFESIKCSIGLLLSTRIGTVPFDPQYGCLIWDKEFSDLYTTSRADIRAALRNSIDRYEKRLYNLSVSVSEVGGTGTEPLGMAAKVKGNYRENDEEKRFEATFKIG